MSGLIGMGIAAYAVEVMSFGLGLWLYKRLGYSARIYFLAHFDWATVWKSFRSWRLRDAGSGIWGVGQVGRDSDHPIPAGHITPRCGATGCWRRTSYMAFNAIASLYEGLMPSISEAISHGKKVLGQYYSP